MTHFDRSSVDPTTLPASASLNLRSAVWQGTSRYEFIGYLGRGGMGTVYEALDRKRKERVAVKTLVHVDAESLSRFKQEFRGLADVLHPNLVHLHELVAVDGQVPFFTMELIEGSDLLAYVAPNSAASPTTTDVRPRGAQTSGTEAQEADPPARRELTVDVPRLRSGLRQLVEGVRTLHAAGIVHRDLKPSNVLVTTEGRVVVLDFGVAVHLRARGGSQASDEIVGTPEYMSPEQALGEDLGPASDWYSLGIMLYEALVGHPPFAGTTVEILEQKCDGTTHPPSALVDGVPADLEELCMRLLAVDPAQRPTVREIARALGQTVSEAPRAMLHASAKGGLVGRGDQLTALESAFEDSRRGRLMLARVFGGAGLGKSALVHRFLDGVEQRDAALVMRGRVYERESVPFKAVDIVVEALAGHLASIKARGESLAMPPDTGALARVFPALGSVYDIDASKVPTGDPQILRQQAFGALRQIFRSICERQPVIVFIDDVQWGDIDSAALLVELVRPPEAPPLLLVMTYRTEEADTSAFLSEMSARWPEDVEVRDVAVDALTASQAKEFVLGFLGGDGESEQSAAEQIARDAGGNPLLLEELARGVGDPSSARIAAQPVSGLTTLDDILIRRAAKLPGPARTLLEVVAVGGRPLPVASLAEAAQVPESGTQLVALLHARRLVRTGLRDGVDVVDAIHDRVRDTLIAQLPADTIRQHHASLARVLERDPDSDPEAITSHLLGAGDNESATRFAERAGDLASSKLAFAQAARLFELAADTVTYRSPEGLRLRVRAAQAAEWAGLPDKSARLYLVAAELAPGLERTNLERAAAAQLVAAGRIDEGAGVLRRVLETVGRRVPASIVAILLWTAVYRFVYAIALRAKPKTGKELTANQRARLDALSAAARGFGVVDPISALYVKARYVLDALRLGDSVHIVHAAATEAATLASGGGRVSKRESALFALALRVAEQSKDREGLALYQIVFGMGQYLRGQWRDAVGRLDAASKALAAARRWNANANVYSLYARVNLGKLREVKSQATRLMADAESRGDRYTAVNLRASHPIAAWLAADDLQGARRHIGESLALWSRTRFLVQHWQAMFWEAEAALYEGDGEGAWQRLARDERALKRSFLLSVQLIRINTLYARGCAAVASLPSLSPKERRGRLVEAERAAEKLHKENMPWASVLATMVAAAVARARDDVPSAEGLLERAHTLATGAAMSAHAAAANYQRGAMLGGDRGDEMKSEAEAALQACGVRMPERYVAMLLPGAWRAQ